MTRRGVLTLLKFAVSVALVGLLVWQAVREAQGHRQQWAAGGPKNWWLLAAAWVVTFTSVLLTVIRWYYLVRALDIPFRMRDAFRLGFLGYMFNFVSLGSVGGDLFRAFWIAHEAKEHRAEAVATVLIDRIIGLYVLFLIAAAAIWYNGLAHSNVPEIKAICWLTWISSGVGLVGIIMLLIPGFTTGALSELLGALPRVGPTIAKVIAAVRIYRKRLGVLTWVTVITVAVHGLSTLGMYLSARGLVGQVPSMAEHFVIVPLALVAGALPLPMMGLGAVEVTMDVLYRHVPKVVHITTANVLLIACAYRVIQILNALVGGGIYLYSRREVSDLMHEAEEEIDPEGASPVVAE